MQTLANRVYDELAEWLGTDLVGVAYFTQDSWGVVDTRADLREKYPDEVVIENIIKPMQLDSLASPLYEEPHGERLTATCRLYEHIVVAAILVGEEEGEGLILGLERGTDYSLVEVVDHVQMLATQESAD
ncbi:MULTISPECIES: hypothetical protein [unclassified Haladaptatus]|uniref:hypothetical protein n=1 Tax=unclassified Haladaptatus TaxID=2622732 RepID=UPI0023E8E855|nr:MULTISPECIES: hypothetical protein [unclassified Haladaptatus]